MNRKTTRRFILIVFISTLKSHVCIVYITDIYGDTMVSFYLLLLNLVILYTPTTLSDDLYNEVLSLFIELFYKRVRCSLQSWSYRDNPFTAPLLFLPFSLRISLSICLWSVERPFIILMRTLGKSRKRVFISGRFIMNSQRLLRMTMTMIMRTKLKVNQKLFLKHGTFFLLLSIPRASELIYKLLSNITHTYQSYIPPSLYATR